MSDERNIRDLQLEIGGSVFELIEFTLTRTVRGQPVRGRYGVNVAKVREVVRMPHVNPLASRVPGVAGVFELRGVPIPAVNLAVALGDRETEPRPDQQIIVTEFSQKRAGFVVDQAHRIRRIAWEKVLPPSADAGSCINGMTLVEDNEFLFILDLERILINLEQGDDAASRMMSHAAAPASTATATAFSRGSQPSSVGSSGARILLVDDSAFIRAGVRQALSRVGYQVVEAGDGVEALAALEESAVDGNPIDLIVSDVEMPRMDGLSFVKKVRAHEIFRETPIVLHTSLSGKANQSAGMQVGANGYVIKNDFKTLFELLREILGEQGLAGAGGAGRNAAGA
jgi:two-component system chemotaxis response regulator CheV